VEGGLFIPILLVLTFTPGGRAWVFRMVREQAGKELENQKMEEEMA
jgi:hypothetical protein